VWLLFLNWVGFEGVSFAVSSDAELLESSDLIGSDEMSEDDESNVGTEARKAGEADDLGESELALSEEEFEVFCDTTFSIKEGKLFEQNLLAVRATDPNRWINKLSALHQAVLYGNLNLCKRLLQVRPTMIDSRDKAGLSVFAYALSEGFTEIAKFLLGEKRAFLQDTVEISFHQNDRKLFKINHACLVKQYVIVLAVIYDHEDTVKWFFDVCLKKSKELFLEVLKNSFTNNFTYNLLVVSAGLESPKSAKLLLGLLNALPDDLRQEFLMQKFNSENLIYRVAKILIESPWFLEGDDGYIAQRRLLEQLFKAILKMDERSGFTLVGQTSQNKKMEKTGKSLIAKLILSISEKPAYSKNVSRSAIALLKIMQQVMVGSEKKAQILSVLAETGHGKTALQLADKLTSPPFKTEVVAILKQIDQECRSALDRPVIEGVQQGDGSERSDRRDAAARLSPAGVLPSARALLPAEQGSGSRKTLADKAGRSQLSLSRSSKDGTQRSNRPDAVAQLSPAGVLPSAPMVGRALVSGEQASGPGILDNARELQNLKDRMAAQLRVFGVQLREATAKVMKEAMEKAIEEVAGKGLEQGDSGLRLLDASMCLKEAVQKAFEEVTGKGLEQGDSGLRLLDASMRLNDGGQERDVSEASPIGGADLRSSPPTRAVSSVHALVSAEQGTGSGRRSLDNGSALQFSRGIPVGDPEGFCAWLRDFQGDSKELLEDLWKFLETEAKKPDAFAKLVQTVDSAGNNMFHILASRFEGRLTQDSKEFLGKFIRLLSAEQMVFLFFQENLEKQQPIDRLIRLKCKQIAKVVYERRKQIDDVLMELRDVDSSGNRNKRQRDLLTTTMQQDDAQWADLANKRRKLKEVQEKLEEMRDAKEVADGTLNDIKAALLREKANMQSEMDKRRSELRAKVTAAR
jgi:hypothetical protein